MKKINVLGYEVCDTTYTELLEEINSIISSSQRGVVIALNPNKIMLARKDEKIHEILLKSELLIPDGTGILFAAKHAKTPIENRITGVGLFEEMCKEGNLTGGNFFLYGAREGVAEAARLALQQNNPAIKISGWLDGYSDMNDSRLEQINNSGANILAVALGSPKQELWIDENFDKLQNIKVFIGVGGAFDVISGRIKRAPKWIRKAGLEWIYRIVLQPFARFKHLFMLTRFCFVVLSRKK